MTRITSYKYRSFRGDENGSMTIEAVLWIPMFVIMMAMVADVSFVFFRQSAILRVVQDANRAFSVGRLSSEAETSSYVKDSLSHLSLSVSTSTTLASGVITTTAYVPVSDLTAVGMFDFLSGYQIGVNAQHFLEY